MRLLAIILVLLIIWLAWMIARWVSRRQAQKFMQEPWKVSDPEHLDDVVNVMIEKPGEQPILIGSVLVTLPHWEFEDELTGLRIQAQDKADAMNRR